MSIKLEVEQMSDTEAIITATGSFAAPTPSQRGARVMLVAPIAQAASGNAALVNNTMGSTNGSVLQSADVDPSTFRRGGQTVQTLRLVFNLNHAEGDTVSGSVRLTLPSGCVLASVGSTGEVWYGNDNNANLLTQTGDWTIKGPRLVKYGNINLRGGLGPKFAPNRAGLDKMILYGSYNWAAKYRSFLVFDLTSRAAGITRATLRLEVTGLDTSDTVNLGRMTSNTWGFYGGVPDPRTGVANASSLAISKNGVHEFDVTSAVLHWLQHPNENYGWMIWKSNEGSGSMSLTNTELVIK